MNILVLGAAGFIGTNLSLKLLQDESNIITLVDRQKSFFASDVLKQIGEKLKCVITNIGETTNFEELVADQDIVFHLVSSTVPATTNQHIQEELSANILMTSALLDACVKKQVKKVVFLSSGGTVYGKVNTYPIKEDAPQFPINTYGLQKLTIEKLLYLYNYMYGLDYRVIRLSNPYGPYQKPNGVQGVVTTFIYNALNHLPSTIYGDGEVVRDFIFIDDAVEYIVKIAYLECEYKLFNLGCGYGTSVNELVHILRKKINPNLMINYKETRQVDVPVNYLDVSRLESQFGKLQLTSLEEGIQKTVDFFSREKKGNL